MHKGTVFIVVCENVKTGLSPIGGVKEAWQIMEVKPLQPLKAALPMCVTFWGIVMEVKILFEKASFVEEVILSIQNKVIFLQKTKLCIYSFF